MQLSRSAFAARVRLIKILIQIHSESIPIGCFPGSSAACDWRWLSPADGLSPPSLWPCVGLQVSIWDQRQKTGRRDANVENTIELRSTDKDFFFFLEAKLLGFVVVVQIWSDKQFLKRVWVFYWDLSNIKHTIVWDQKTEWWHRQRKPDVLVVHIWGLSFWKSFVLLVN